MNKSNFNKLFFLIAEKFFNTFKICHQFNYYFKT
jgi:hypothetical protein